jgi:hypothetical protein
MEGIEESLEFMGSLFFSLTSEVHLKRADTNVPSVFADITIPGHSIQK